MPQPISVRLAETWALFRNRFGDGFWPLLTANGESRASHLSENHNWAETEYLRANYRFLLRQTGSKNERLHR